MAVIDVVIPVYNQSLRLGRCLESVSRQTFRDANVIVVDDGSSDDVSKAVQPYREGLTLIRQTNRGASAARNRGAREGTAPYILFCDADITLKKNTLQTLHSTHRQNFQTSFSYSSFRFGWKTFRPGPFDAKRLQREPYIHTTSLIARRDFPGFDETLTRFQDWDLYLAMTEQGKSGVWIDEVLFTIAPGGSMSRWLPRFAYRLFPWLPAVQRYQDARAIILRKHGLIARN